MNKFFRTLIISIALFIAVSPVLVSAVEIVNPLESPDIKTLLEKIFSAVTAIVGLISAIMIIVAGIMYLLSAGSPEKINSAKKALIYAIAGIVIALLAEAIVAAVKWVIGAD
jgi:magnesium-transporting ATPase (P-type)